jgi:hypothetical protein
VDDTRPIRVEVDDWSVTRTIDVKVDDAWPIDVKVDDRWPIDVKVDDWNVIGPISVEVDNDGGGVHRNPPVQRGGNGPRKR